MEIRAYDEIYLASAQNVLGHAIDFAIMTLNLDPDEFGKAFIVSDVSRQFAGGNPRFVAGMNGCELARQALYETHMPFTDAEDAMFLDKSPEYWAGWALAFYQWFSARSFEQLQRDGLSIEIVISLYPTHHEADLTKFAQTADAIIREHTEKHPRSLKTLRKEAHLTQQELSELSGVTLRMIQAYEQGDQDIRRAEARAVLALARALGCRVEMLFG